MRKIRNEARENARQLRTVIEVDVDESHLKSHKRTQ